jgi:hypothetical protein
VSFGLLQVAGWIGICPLSWGLTKISKKQSTNNSKIFTQVGGFDQTCPKSWITIINLWQAIIVFRASRETWLLLY